MLRKVASNEVIDLRDVADYVSAKRIMRSFFEREEAGTRFYRRRIRKAVEIEHVVRYRKAKYGEESQYWKGLYLSYETPDVICLLDDSVCAYEVTEVFPGRTREMGQSQRELTRKKQLFMARTEQELMESVPSFGLQIGLRFSDALLDKIYRNHRSVRSKLLNFILTHCNDAKEQFGAYDLSKAGIEEFEAITISRGLRTSVSSNFCGYDVPFTTDSIVTAIQEKYRKIERAVGSSFVYEDSTFSIDRVTLLLHVEFEGECDLFEAAASDVKLVCPEIDFFEEVILNQGFGSTVNVRRT